MILQHSLLLNNNNSNITFDLKAPLKLMDSIRIKQLIHIKTVCVLLSHQGASKLLIVTMDYVSNNRFPITMVDEVSTVPTCFI